MTTENPAQTLPARQTENGTGIAKRVPIEEREVVYMPFQAAEKITLTAGMVVKFLCKPTKRGFTCSAEQAVRFMMLCKARALNPWEGDAFLVGYDGNDGPEFNLITAHQAFLKRAEAHPEFEGMESGVMLMDDNGVITETQGDFIPPKLNLVGGWAKVWRKDRKFPCYRRLNRQVFDKGFSVWKSNPAGMIVKCAEMDSLRSSFPNSLAGMYGEGELGPVQVESHTAPEATPPESRTATLLAKVNKVTSRPVSEGQTLEPTAEALQEENADLPMGSTITNGSNTPSATPVGPTCREFAYAMGHDQAKTMGIPLTEEPLKDFIDRRDAKKAEANAAKIAMDAKELPATQTASTAPPAASTPAAGPVSAASVAANAGQAGETQAKPVALLSDAALVEAMGAIAQSAAIPEAIMMEWLKKGGDRRKLVPKHRAEVLAAWTAEVKKMQAAPVPLEAP